MQTYKLWFECDPDIPEFKKLAYELVAVDIKDILLNGVHPWSDRQTYRALVDGFTHSLNLETFRIPQLAELKYCNDVHSYVRSNYYRQYSQFEELLERINDSIRFVDDLTFQRMLSIAKEKLTNKWDHMIVKQIVLQMFHTFNDIRSFIKSKDISIKLTSYSDLDKYDLSKILSLQDLETEDQIIISYGLPVQNFRKMDFLQSVTTEDGLLKLVNSIDHFDLLPAENHHGHVNLLYRGKLESDNVKLIPDFHDDAIRKKALEIAKQWRTDRGNYCFRTSIDKLREMTDEMFKISFPKLDYIDIKEPYQSQAIIRQDRIQTFSIGPYLTIRNSGEQIKALLRQFGKSMTGNKTKLLEKFSDLAVEQYHLQEENMRLYFSQRQFIKAETGNSSKSNQFPVIAEHGMRNIILTMYLLKHLRGNTIIDASYKNDSYDLLSLAKSLVKEEISLKSQFLQVQ